MVFWIDVDCRITHLPDYVRDSTADFIGFQRSFRSPLQIGYQNRTRFWEPSFWGVNATPAGRKLIDDAFALEQRADIKATDDYFLEEAWRANAPNLTFQMIPSTAVVRRSTASGAASREGFFVFGSSGNVAHYKDKVAQHPVQGRRGRARRSLRQAKKLEKALPEAARRPMRRMVDTLGVTGVLTADSPKGLDPERAQRVNEMLAAGMCGDLAGFEAARDVRQPVHRHRGRRRSLEVAEAFLEHSARGSEQTIRLAWWAKPFPGNFGDWLSPLAVAHYSEANIRLQPVTKATKKPHLVALGSIGRFIRPSSIVVGTGISRDDLELASKARYISVRGPITARVLRESGGPKVEAFGDPGVLLSRILPIERGQTNGRIALVRHHSHRAAPIDLPDHVDELSVLMSRPGDIEAFLRTLMRYDAVLTSAMHVMTACQSYGDPVRAGHLRGVRGPRPRLRDQVRGLRPRRRRRGGEPAGRGARPAPVGPRRPDPRHPRQRGGQGRGGGPHARGCGPRPGRRAHHGQEVSRQEAEGWQDHARRRSSRCGSWPGRWRVPVGTLIPSGRHRWQLLALMLVGAAIPLTELLVTKIFTDTITSDSATLPGRPRSSTGAVRRCCSWQPGWRTTCSGPTGSPSSRRIQSRAAASRPTSRAGGGPSASSWSPS